MKTHEEEHIQRIKLLEEICEEQHINMGEQELTAEEKKYFNTSQWVSEEQNAT